MTLSAVDAVAVLILSAVGAGTGSYVTAYLKKKGENLATHEDIQELVDQVKATTAATEGIKTDLSGRLWVSQERWKMKSDLYIALLSMLHGLMDEAGKGMRAVASGKMPAVSQQDLTGDLKRIFVLVQIVSPHVMNALQKVRALERTPGANDGEYFQQTYDMYRSTYFQVAAIAREDLGFAEPPSEES